MTVATVGHGDNPNIFVRRANAAQLKGLRDILAIDGDTTATAADPHKADVTGQGSSPDVFIVEDNARQIFGEFLATRSGKTASASFPAGAQSRPARAPEVFIVGATPAEGLSEPGGRTPDTAHIGTNKRRHAHRNSLFDYFDETLESEHFRTLLAKAR